MTNGKKLSTFDDHRPTPSLPTPTRIFCLMLIRPLLNVTWKQKYSFHRTVLWWRQKKDTSSQRASCNWFWCWRQMWCLAGLWPSLSMPSGTTHILKSLKAKKKKKKSLERKKKRKKKQWTEENFQLTKLNNERGNSKAINQCNYKILLKKNTEEEKRAFAPDYESICPRLNIHCYVLYSC